MPPSGSAGKSLRKLQSNFKHDMISDAVETPGIKDYLDGKLDVIHSEFVRQNNLNRSREFAEATASLDEFID